MTSTSTRSLQRLPEDLTLTPQQLSKLSALSIYTTKDLFSKTDLELVELCDWDPASVREVTRRVARWIAPGAENVRISMLNRTLRKNVSLLHLSVGALGSANVSGCERRSFQVTILSDRVGTAGPAVGWWDTLFDGYRGKPAIIYCEFLMKRFQRSHSHILSHIFFPVRLSVPRVVARPKSASPLQSWPPRHCYVQGTNHHRQTTRRGFVELFILTRRAPSALSGKYCGNFELNNVLIRSAQCVVQKRVFVSIDANLVSGLQF